MNWIDESIATRRGVAGGSVGATHHLTEEMQGDFHYTIGPYSDPVLSIAPGDRVIVDTMDAFGGAVLTEDDLPSAKLTMPYVNPQNGPIMVEGAEIGDALAVRIESMAPFGENPQGACAMIPEFGALTGTALNRHAQRSAAGEGAHRAARRDVGVLERSRHAAVSAPHRHAEHVANARLDQLAGSR